MRRRGWSLVNLILRLVCLALFIQFEKRVYLVQLTLEFCIHVAVIWWSPAAPTKSGSCCPKLNFVELRHDPVASFYELTFSRWIEPHRYSAFS